MFPAEAVPACYFEERAAEWEAARKAAEESAKAKAQTQATLAQTHTQPAVQVAQNKSQTPPQVTISQTIKQLQNNRPNFAGNAVTAGFFGFLSPFNNRQTPRSFANGGTYSAPSSAPSSAPPSPPASPMPTQNTPKLPSELPMPKATWAGPSEGEVCVVPFWT